MQPPTNYFRAPNYESESAYHECPKIQYCYHPFVSEMLRRSSAVKYTSYFLYERIVKTKNYANSRIFTELKVKFPKQNFPRNEPQFAKIADTRKK